MCWASLLKVCVLTTTLKAALLLRNSKALIPRMVAGMLENTTTLGLHFECKYFYLPEVSTILLAKSNLARASNGAQRLFSCAQISLLS